MAESSIVTAGRRVPFAPLARDTIAATCRTLAFVAVFIAATVATATSQPKHRIHLNGNGWLLEELSSGVKRPFEMWTVRLANGAFDSSFTDAIIANLDDYKRYGVNTIVVGLQGGNSGSASYPRVFNSDGSLDLSSVVWGNMLRLLKETDDRGMVLCAQIWYFLRDQNVPNDADALTATRNATQWLVNTGYQHYIYDIANEFLHGGYGSRPLFKTLNGALELIDACRSVDQGAVIGISPPTRLFSPSGTLSNPTRAVSADYIIGHNTVVDPNNGGSYRLSTKPPNPSALPYVNNEFWAQIPYERTVRNNPRTNEDDYGHFSPGDVSTYLSELQKLVSLGGVGNVHARRLQHVASGSSASTPVAVIGPAGTQPEASPGAGEPSLHWAFRGIARLLRLGPLPNFLDFNDDYAAGVETNLSGTWTVQGGYLRQTDANAANAFARLVADDGDVEVSVDCGFKSAPGAQSAVGFQIGAASESGPAWRVRAFSDRVVLDRVGVSSTPQTRFTPKTFQDQYGLRIRDGRVQLRAGGNPVFDVADDGAVTGRNIFLLTENTDARFDNVRITPLRGVDFESQSTGEWTPVNASVWQIAQKGAGSAWRATVGSGGDAAHLDRRVENFSLAFEADLTAVGAMAVVARTPDVSVASPEGYLLEVKSDGTFTLDRRDASGLTTLATAKASNVNPAAMNIGLVVEGNRVIGTLDGVVVIDGIDPGVALARGDIGLMVRTGTTWIDDIALEVGSSRPPIARFHPFSGQPLPLGFTMEIGDPDGILDVDRFSLAVDAGKGFVDVTFVLIPFFGVFGFNFTPDGRSLLFDLKVAAPVSNVNWTFRLTTTDRDGNTTFSDLRVQVP